MLGYSAIGTVIVNHVPTFAIARTVILSSRMPAVHRSGGTFTHLWTSENR